MRGKPTRRAALRPDLKRVLARARSLVGALARRRRGPRIRRILLALDPSPASRFAVGWARMISAAAGAPVTVLSVVGPKARFDEYTGDPTPLLARELALAKRTVARGVSALRARGVRAGGVVARGEPADQIVGAARRARADLVGLGSRGRGSAGRLLLGSVADAVKDHAASAVLIAKRPARARSILVALDDTPHGRRAAGLGLALAAALGADLRVIRVLPPPPFSTAEELARRFGDLGARLAHLLGRGRHAKVEVRVGREADHLLRAAKARPADLIVVGSRGLRGASRILYGSVSNRLVHQSRGSVLVVR
ncbi:MAG: universal stress protein [Euryarchaeota archaeon]|nr:universal stress protein [Euryarchaeota archaeon]